MILTNRVHPTRDGDGIQDVRRALHDAIFSLSATARRTLARRRVTSCPFGVVNGPFGFGFPNGLFGALIGGRLG